MRKTAVFIVFMMLVAALAASAEGFSVGDTVTFGSYPQGADGEIMPIEWTVLEIDSDGYCVLMSRYGLDVRQYNDEYVGITWEDCAIRKWLNSGFFDEAFSEEERGRIRTTHVVNADDPEAESTAGNDTDDKVYLLSADEAQRYFDMEWKRVCAPTEYAEAKGAEKIDFFSAEDGRPAVVWWLRSPGHFQDSASYVAYDGNIGGRSITYGGAVVRPVIRVLFD